MSTPPASALEAKKVYLKDVSFESPRSPQVFARETLTPKVDTQMHIDHSPMERKTFYEVVLRVTATAYLEDQMLFVAEVQQAGIFRIVQTDDSMVKRLLGTACPHTLLPFAREAVASLVAKGGFPQLLIGAVNFERMYRERLAQTATASTTPNA